MADKDPYARLDGVTVGGVADRGWTRLTIVGFVLSDGPACPGVTGGHCTDATSVWEAVFSVGMLTFVLCAPTAIGVGLYDRLTSPP